MATEVLKERDPDPRSPAARLERLLDPRSAVLLREPGESGVMAVRGRAEGRDVIAYSTDGTRMGGALGSVGADTIIGAIDTAVEKGCPVVGLWHSGGARLADGAQSMDGVGRMFAAMVRASGRVPQVSTVLGPAAGAAAYGPALTDIVVMSPCARLFVTGPDIVRTVTGEAIDMEGLGGPEAHSRKSGLAHVTAVSEADAYARTRQLLDLLTRPAATALDVGTLGDGPDPSALLPDSPRRAYDVHPLVRALIDPEPEFLELQRRWAANMLIGLGRLMGRTIGVLANNPLRKGGCLDAFSAEKASRFVRMCDALGIPLLVIVDVPGYLPGVGQEWGGVVRRGAKLLHAFAEAVVPRVTLITRKSFGGAYVAMNSRALGASAVFAWPNAEVDVMGAEAAVRVLHRRELAAVSDSERIALRQTLIERHRRASGGVGRALDLGVVDEVVQPAHTRRRLAQAFDAAPSCRGRHTNIPL